MPTLAPMKARTAPRWAGWERRTGGVVAVPTSGSVVPANLTLAPKVWLFIDGEWVDISSYVLYESGINVERGRQSESDSIDHSKLTLTLKNFDPHPWTPRLPTSPYFGLLDRNTPIRVSRGPIDYTTTSYLYLPGTAGTWVLTPDSSSLSITGDIELILDIALDSWRDAQDIASKYTVDGNDRAWAVNIDEDGILQWVWSADGTNTTAAFSTIPVPAADGERLAIKITFDVNNGAAGNDTRFYISANSDQLSDGPWQQLGATVTGSGTTSIFDSDSDVVLGDIPTSGNAPMAGKWYRFVLRQGIGGTIRARPEFTEQDEETDSFDDSAGNTWQLAGAAQFVEQVTGPFRFHGEVSEWPVVSDVTGNFVTVTIEAAGIWRRLSQNEQPVNSAMFRAHTHPSLTRVKAYWSCEVGAEATEIASNATQVAGFPMRISGTPQLASYSEWTGSDALPVMTGASFYGRVPSWTPTGSASAYMFCFVDEAVAAETSLLHVTTSGTAKTFDIRLLANGNLRLKAYDDDGVAIDDGAGNLDAELNFDLNPRGFLMLGLHLLQSGTSIKWFLAINDFTNTDLATGTGITASYLSGTITTKTFNTITSVTVGREGGLAQVVIGHICVSDRTTVRLDDVGDAVNAFNGENPATRLLRLGGEDQIPIDIAADKAKITGNSVVMGDQTIKTETELLTEVETTDLGLLAESRDRFALRYRTRLSMANQDPAFTLSHAAHELAETLRPVDDDRLTVNEQYVIRDRGIKAYKSKTSGKLSNLRPRLGGVGRYPDEKTISVAYDQQVADQAGFRLLLGTVDGARYPQIVINLHHPSIAADLDLLASILAMDIGDRVVITDLPDYLPPDDISVIVRGYTERIDQFTHTMTLTCVPEAPWQWATADDQVKRVGATTAETTADSHTIAFVDDAATLNSAGTTSVTVNVPAGTADGHLLVTVIGIIGQETITAPAGWTLIGTQDAGANVRTAAYWRVASSEPASYNWSWTSSFKNSGWIGAYSGVYTTDPIDDFDSDGTATPGTGFAAAATVGDPAGFLITSAFERHAFTGAATTWTSSDTSDGERVDQGSNAGSGFDISHAVYDSGRRLNPGAATRTLTASQATGQTATWAIALTPAWGLTVATTSGPVAINSADHPGDFPFRIRVAGVVLEVTAVSGATSPQTFTVTQTPLNGVVKTIPSGSSVQVADPAYIGLV
jgi:hypothetical protein